MAWSKSTRIIILLVIDSAFFLLELITGYAVHSLALVADSFHMLNDVLSLCVGLWAVKMANRTSAPKMYTYGYQRAETLGALVNGVFLVALCVTIFLDAIQRFVEPQEVTQPKLVLIVGCLGLASNIVGLALFHDHGHGGHSHGGHSHGDFKDAEEGRAGHTHDHGAGEIAALSYAHPEVVRPAESTVNGSKVSKVTISSDTAQHAPSAPKRAGTTGSESTAVDEGSPSATRNKRKHSRSTSKGLPAYDDFAGPTAFRNSIIAAGSGPLAEDSEEGTDGENAVGEEDEDTIERAGTTTEPLLGGKPQNGYGATQRKSIDHHEHKHRQPKEPGTGSGHSHGDLNMRGIFLHVMGDALGNIGVIVTALIIWLTDYSWRFYFDPAISLVITIIILCSAIPLCKAASRILLQAVPHGIEVDDIRADIEDLPGIESAHHLHVWQLSDTKLVASLHVKVNFNFKGEGSQRYMQLAQAIRECLHEYGIHSSTIQPEFTHDGSDDGHDHGNGAYSHDRSAVGSAKRAASAAADKSCLLECGDDCGNGQSCCPPQAGSQDAQSHDGHDHAH